MRHYLLINVSHQNYWLYHWPNPASGSQLRHLRSHFQTIGRRIQPTPPQMVYVFVSYIDRAFQLIDRLFRDNILPVLCKLLTFCERLPASKVCRQDIIALVVQSVGGAMASTASTHQGAETGGNIVLGGIAFQLGEYFPFRILSIFSEHFYIDHSYRNCLLDVCHRVLLSVL
jgi:hypothetical protein